MLYGGSIAPGRFRGHDVTIVDLFEAIGAHAAGNMSDEDLRELEDVASPGPGACGGQFTANTMACAFEALGISPGGSAMVPAVDDEKATVAEKIGELVMHVPRRGPAAEQGDHPRLARERDRDGVRIGRVDQRRPPPARRRSEAGVELDIDDFERISRSHAAAGGPQAGRALRRHRPLPRRRRAADPQPPRRGGHPARGCHDGHRPHHRRGGRRRARDRGPGGRAPAVRAREGRPAGWRSCAATSRPRARW